MRGLAGSLVVAAMAASTAAWAVGSPVSGDFQAILHGQSKETTVWRYSGNQKIYLFDFPGLTKQGRSFNRVTQLTEQQFNEPYPRVLRTDELDQYIAALRRTQADFAFGHDILVSEFVQFFNLADRDKVELFPEEIEVKDFLIANGLMRGWRGFYTALEPSVVILAVPQTQERQAGEPPITIGARTAILMHEMAHGEYYTNPFYSTYCRRFWAETLTENQRELFKKFLSKYNYSTLGEELVINEMQAYLMFTPDVASFSAKKLGISVAELEGLREAFRRGRPPTKLPLTLDGLR